MVVCGEEHLDEISCAGRTRVWEFKRGEEGQPSQFKESIISPETFGLDMHPLSAVAGGRGPEQNAETFKSLLMARNEEALKELMPVLEFVLINAAALLVVAGVAEDFKQGVKMAKESILSGSAWSTFEAFRDWDRASSGLEAM
jgi:anthranilate phosphoribosyltransferase